MVLQGKNKDDKVVESWNAPLIIAGNESIAMKAGKDAGGRMSRRIIPFAFQMKVENKDRTLLGQIQKDMAAIIHCCTWGFKVGSTLRYRVLNSSMLGNVHGRWFSVLCIPEPADVMQISSTTPYLLVHDHRGRHLQ